MSEWLDVETGFKIRFHRERWEGNKKGKKGKKDKKLGFFAFFVLFAFFASLRVPMKEADFVLNKSIAERWRASVNWRRRMGACAQSYLIGADDLECAGRRSFWYVD
jgi:hypothetical protein